MPMSPRLLRPRASGGVHPDARDWASRVTTAGGSVGSSTLAAVSKFCADIDAAGLRGRFYRLNLFCGSNLEAALVPLYRGTSRTATQHGNTTDANVNFVAGDFVETGSATAGLKGNGSSKYLNTGFNPVTASASDADFHLWIYTKDTEATGTTRLAMGANASATSETFIGWVSGGTVENGVIAGGGSARRLIGSGGLQGSLAVVASSGKVNRAYHNGIAATSGDGTATGTFANLPLFVFCWNNNGSPANYTLARYFRAYSIGLAFTESQAATYHTILTTFQTTLGRAV